jgi:hypothetical protein
MVLTAVLNFEHREVVKELAQRGSEWTAMHRTRPYQRPVEGSAGHLAIAARKAASSSSVRSAMTDSSNGGSRRARRNSSSTGSSLDRLAVALYASLTIYLLTNVVVTTIA